jgi:predicted nucleic acid-binding protein
MPVIDACVWVAAFNSKDVFHQRAKSELAILLQKDLVLYVPGLVFPEVAGSLVRRTDSEIVASKAVSLMRRMGLEIWEVDEALERESTHCAITLKLRGADAVYVALAKETGEILVTFDQQLAERASKVVEILLLK